jgi:hypothetical protein
MELRVGIEVADSAEVPIERLEAEICELAGHIWAATCRWLVLLAEFDRREGWGAWGIKSCAHWLSWRCGVSLPAAREKIRVARRLVKLPLIREAFGRGELSYSRVRALSRVARPETEPELLEAARYATTSQLERIVWGYRFVVGQLEVKEANDRHEERFVRWHWDDDGSLVFSTRLDPEDGAALLAAIEGAEAGLVATDVSAETPREARRADALAAVAQAAVGAMADGHLDAAAPYEVVVHVDAPVLAGECDEGRSRLDDGPSLPPETVRRLACDAAFVAVTEGSDGTPLDVGRKTRAIPPRLRRALRSRDGGCRFPGCGQRRFVDGHHVRHWAHGGATDLANLLLLCHGHHRAVHEGGYRIERPQPHVFMFIGPDGRPIPNAPALARPKGPGLPRQHHGLDISPGTCRSLGEGERFDAGLTIDALLGPRAFPAGRSTG